MSKLDAITDMVLTHNLNDGCDEQPSAPVEGVALVKDVARFMAYAYWRGRLRHNRLSLGEDFTERIIKRRGESDAKEWEASATALLSMNGHLSSQATTPHAGEGES